MFNRVCLFIYGYRCLLGFYLFCFGLVGMIYVDFELVFQALRPQTIIPFLEVIAYQVK